ncbi:MAG: hypothetical protein ABFD75_12290 [Smithella sp.]
MNTLKIIIITIVLTLCTTLSLAAAKPQNLVAEPCEIQMASVEIEVTRGETVTYTTVPYAVTDGEVILLNLDGWQNGKYIFRARWADTSGWWSDWSEPLTAVKSGKPGNILVK